MDDLQEIERQLQRVEASSRLSSISDETLVTEELACIYLNISPRQLKNLREGEDGPNFFKPLPKGAEKANVSPSYEMGELRRWKKEHIFDSNFDAANRSGINKWFGEPSPFFTEDFKRNLFSVLAPADDVSRDDWGDRLASAISGEGVVVEWMIPSEAAVARWSDAVAHEKFAGKYLSALESEKNRVMDSLCCSGLKSEI